MVKIGIIGGTGLSSCNIFSIIEEKVAKTPYGPPSSPLIIGKIDGVDCVLLSRHGRSHTISPTRVNYRANLYALKKEGCTHVIVSTACGSLKEYMHPGQFVILDDFIDRTRKRETTFYDGSNDEFQGIAHLPMDAPFCTKTRNILIDCLKSLGYGHHEKGTAITIEGPRFSTRSESLMFRQWGGDIVNMTTVPEAILARELGMCYAAVAMVTDYDCWKEGEKIVTVDNVMTVFRQNVSKVIEIFQMAIPRIASEEWTEYINDLKKNVQSNIQVPSE